VKAKKTLKAGEINKRLTKMKKMTMERIKRRKKKKTTTMMTMMMKNNNRKR
jgi:hypothetical protein